MNLPATTPQNEGDLVIPERLKKILMNSVFKNLDEDEALVAWRLAKRRGLDVEARQIYFVPYTDKKGRRSVIQQTSIDGLRLIAHRSGTYGGQVNPKLTIRLKDGSKQVIPHEEYDPNETKELISATISVINKDFPQPQQATALFKSYAQTYNGQLQGLWGTKTDIMLLKCAESQALRKAFPEEVGGIYSNEEMDQAKNDLEAINVEFAPVQKEPVQVNLPPPNPEPPTEETPVSVPIEQPVSENPVTEESEGINSVWARFVAFCKKSAKDPALAIQIISDLVCDRFKIGDPAKIPTESDATLTLFLKTAGLSTLEAEELI
ncbi:MAG: RecT family recombinase [Pseudomonadota bacterium]